MFKHLSLKGQPLEKPLRGKISTTATPIGMEHDAPLYALIRQHHHG